MPESNRLPCHLLFGLYYPCLTLLPGTDDHAATLWLVYLVLYPLPGIEPMVLNLCLLISYGLLPCGYSLGVSPLLTALTAVVYRPSNAFCYPRLHRLGLLC